MEGPVTRVIPWMRAFPDRVALGSLSMELRDVKTCLYAYNPKQSGQCLRIVVHLKLTATKIELWNKSFHGSSGSKLNP